MRRKLLLSIIFFFMFHLLMFPANNKAKTIEFLLWEQLEIGNHIIYELDVAPENLDQETTISTDKFMTITIPPSPDSEMLFFLFNCQGVFQKANSEYREAKVSLRAQVMSDLIPSNINVYILAGLSNLNERNVGGSYDIAPLQERREPKIALTRTNIGYWSVYYNSGGRVPDEEAIPILNSLMDNGFDMEFIYEGLIRGISYIRLAAFTIEVTRLSKN